MTHAGLEITADQIRELIGDQQPALAGRPLALGARGWDNQTWRLGDDLAVRLPWATTRADELLRKEYAWMPALAPRLPLPVPVPQFLGEPSARLPRPWLITTWVPGEPADRAPVTRYAAAADTLAAFLSALHQPAPAGAPAGDRGQPLAGWAGEFDRWLAEATERELIPDPDALRAVWADAVAAPAWDGPPVWLHGDLHAANVLTADGTLCGVIDFGELGTGDPAADLGSCWLLLPGDAVDRCHGAYRPAVDDATRRRARGRALVQALGCLLVGDAGVRGEAGGKASWLAPAAAALRQLAADVRG